MTKQDQPDGDPVDEGVSPTSPVPVASIAAVFAIRWTCDRDEGVSTDVVDRFEDVLFSAHVTSVPLRAPEQEVEFTALPQVSKALRSAFLGLADLLAESLAAQPTSLMSVSISFDHALETLISNKSTLVVSYHRLSDVIDLVLYTASRALKKWSKGRPMGPISRANLVGSGLLVPISTAGDALLSLPIFQHPDLGTWSPASPAQSESDGDFLTPVPANLRRLYMWTDRYDLRRARGEWSEALVALQASQEQFVHGVAQTLLLDHGWRAADFNSAADLLNNHMQTLSLIQHHLGGDWKAVRSDQSAIWQARNAVIHSAEPVSEKSLKQVATKTRSLIELLQSRLGMPRIAHAHPLTCTMYLLEGAEGLIGSEVVRFLMSQLDMHPIQDTIDVLDFLTAPPRSSGNPRQCDGARDSWNHWAEAAKRTDGTQSPDVGKVD